MSDKMNELAKKLNPRLSDVLDSVAAAKGEDKAVAIERVLKTTAILACVLGLVNEKHRQVARKLIDVAVDNITTLGVLAGIDPEDVHGASIASRSDLNDLFPNR